MVSHNLYLLKKYNVYINMEVYFSIKKITYLYKHICKGYDLAEILVMQQFKKDLNLITKFIYYDKLTQVKLVIDFFVKA